jgi:hypothetical protein
MRRSIVLSLSVQLVFPAAAFQTYLVPAVSYVAQSVHEIDHRHVGLALRVSL